MSADGLRAIRVWDLPTRVFHWTLVACFVGLVVSGKMGGAAMPWHARIGYAVASLLLFRLAWGLMGGHWSRFRAFLFPLRSVLTYLRGNDDPADSVGHNPLGALSVFTLLVFLALQVATGLFSEDKAEFAGPLNALVSSSTARALTWYHKNIGQAVLLSLVALHLAAVAFYCLRRKEDLVRPMLHGNKILGFDAPSSRDDVTSRLAAAVVLSTCAALVVWLVNLVGS